MGRIFNSARFGQPQILAGLLLLVFVGECLWLVAHEYPSTIPEDDLARVEEGVALWHGSVERRRVSQNTRDTGHPPEDIEHPKAAGDDSNDPNHSPLWYLIGAAPVTVFGVSEGSRLWIWLTRAPYVLFGTLLGGSLWYVSRRLYGNAGGYIALALYCFSPAVIRASALWDAKPEIGGLWGVFGAVFTAIAVSHTLYAPREVVLWNWRRIVLLGVSLALAVGSQFGLAIILPLLLAFMLYLAPERKTAAVVILAAASAVGLTILFCAYFFHAGRLCQDLARARPLDISWRALAMPGAYLQFVRELAASGLVVVLLVPTGLIAYGFWRRCRYFGNTAPLIASILFAAFRVLCPHATDSSFSLMAVIFITVFVSGISADLLETKARELAIPLLAGILGANAVWNVIGLARIVY